MKNQKEYADRQVNGRECSVCKRSHRFINQHDSGLWAGSRCMDNLKEFTRTKGDKNGIWWHGYEMQYNRIARLLGHAVTA